MRVKCLAQEHNAVPRPGLEPGPPDPESSALTISYTCLYLGASSLLENDKSSETASTAGQVPDAAPAAQLSSKRNSVSQGQQTITNNSAVVEDLFAHRGAICVPYRRLSSARYIIMHMSPCNKTFTPPGTRFVQCNSYLRRGDSGLPVLIRWGRQENDSRELKQRRF